MRGHEKRSASKRRSHKSQPKPTTSNTDQLESRIEQSKTLWLVNLALTFWVGHVERLRIDLAKELDLLDYHALIRGQCHSCRLLASLLLKNNTSIRIDRTQNTRRKHIKWKHSPRPLAPNSQVMEHQNHHQNYGTALEPKSDITFHREKEIKQYCEQANQTRKACNQITNVEL